MYTFTLLCFLAAVTCGQVRAGCDKTTCTNLVTSSFSNTDRCRNYPEVIFCVSTVMVATNCTSIDNADYQQYSNYMRQSCNSGCNVARCLQMIPDTTDTSQLCGSYPDALTCLTNLVSNSNCDATQKMFISSNILGIQAFLKTWCRSSTTVTPFYGTCDKRTCHNLDSQSSFNEDKCRIYPKVLNCAGVLTTANAGCTSIDTSEFQRYSDLILTSCQNRQCDLSTCLRKMPTVIKTGESWEAKQTCRQYLDGASCMDTLLTSSQCGVDARVYVSTQVTTARNFLTAFCKENGGESLAMSVLTACFGLVMAFVVTNK